MSSRTRPPARPSRAALLPRATATGSALLIAMVALGPLASAAPLPASAAPRPPGVATTSAARTPSEISVEAVVDRMSQDELIGQLLWAPVFGTRADAPDAQNSARYGVATPAEVVEEFHLGGVIYFGWADNIEDPVQLAELSNGLQESAIRADSSGVPLAIGVDQEGGTVARIGEPATELPGGMALGAAGDPALARAQGAVLGEELAAMGINVDYAPSVDLNTNPANPVIGLRSMGEDPELVGELGAAQLRGLAQHGVTGAAKHFPGHGDTDVDSHVGLPVVDYDRDELDEHLRPFAVAIDEGASMIMSAHIVVEAVDPDLPATLSPDVLTGLLREEMGFEGVITTDALDMGALKELPGNPLADGDIAAMAIEAGADVLLVPPDVPAAIAGIERAIDAGTITQERLEESVTRVLEWKERTGLLERTALVEPEAADRLVGHEDHLATATEIAERGTTLLRNDDDLLPLARGTEVVVASGAAREALSDLLADADLTVVDHPADAEVAVVEIGSGSPDDELATADRLAAEGTPTIAVLARGPYDHALLAPEITAVLTGYGEGGVNRSAAAAVIAGDAAPGGSLPVTVPGRSGEEPLETGFGLRTGSQASPQAPTFTDDTEGRGSVVSVPDVAGVVYLLDGEPVAAGDHDAALDADVRARPVGAHWFEPGTLTAWHPEVDEPTRASPETPASPTDPGPAPDEANPIGWGTVSAITGIIALMVIGISWTIFSKGRAARHK